MKARVPEGIFHTKVMSFKILKGGIWGARAADWQVSGRDVTNMPGQKMPGQISLTRHEPGQII